jgi:translin
MDMLPSIAERIHQALEARTQARDRALAQARQLTRHAAHAIRAIHREEREPAYEHLAEARKIIDSLQSDLKEYPELFYAGYTQDAIKEFAEASITCALIEHRTLPAPEELQVEFATYLNGLAETVGELRRRCLDILRHGYSGEAERLLGIMDDIYGILITMDYPDAVTNGLRRQTDVMRGIVEKTRGDLTIAIREQHLEQTMQDITRRMESMNKPGQPPAKPENDNPGE